MLRIKMDRNDVPDDEELDKAGWEIDSRGRQSMDFVYLIHRESSPKTLEEVYKFMQKTFFFPPCAVWIDGKEVD